MRKVLYLIIYVSLLFLSACDVHEWPETSEFVKCHLRLNYETDITEYEHLYDGTSVIEQGLGETYDNHREYGKIRYIIRTYPLSETMRTASDFTQEFVFTKDISKGYAHEVTLDLLPGNYNIMVWSDLVKSSGNTYFYNTDNFAEITLQSDHKGNNDYRDAFKGKVNISLPTNSTYQINQKINIDMKRPLAKFEIIANDLSDFIEAKHGDINLYKAKIQYVGFMPNVYSIIADRPVASITGEILESTLTKLTDTEVSMGFDYVFVSDRGSTVTVRIGIYDNKGQQVSLSEPITIPVKPSHHTLIRGKFLMQNTTNGVNINPNWGGDYNIIL